MQVCLQYRLYTTLKVLCDSYECFLDRGGAITGQPSGRRQQQQQQQQQQQIRVENSLPSGISSVSSDTSISIKILNSLNVGYAITGPPAAQTPNRYWLLF